MKKIYFFALIIIFSSSSFAQLFTQDFSSSTNLNDYFSATPSANQFNHIAALSSSTETSISASGNNLLFTRTSATASAATYAAAVRSSKYAPAPQFIKISFDVDVPSFVSSGSNDGVRFYLGGGQAADNSIPATTSVPYSWLRIQPTALGQLKIIDGVQTFTATPVLSGTQNITWILNNTGAEESYTGPDGASYTIANDKYDLWYGTTRGITAKAVNKADSTMNSFKIIAVSARYGLSIDNLVITDLQSPLPVKLISFYAKGINKKNVLTWSTATETNNSHFNMERSVDGKEFATIGNIRGAGNSTSISNYSFTDEQPVQGTTNYYRLKQVDFNGQYEYSKIVSVHAGNESETRLVSVNALQSNAWVYSSSDTRVLMNIYDIAGRLMYEEEFELFQGNNKLDFSKASMVNGLHIVRIGNNEGVLLSGKFIR